MRTHIFCKKQKKQWFALVLLSVVCVCLHPVKVSAEETNKYEDYVSILYNSENGMVTSEANDIMQTDDGFIWIASYSGLIRYDGKEFRRISDIDGVASANTLFKDSKGRLWIGTNDNGVVLYNYGQYETYNMSNGLLSNSVRAIEEDSKGNLYVGTTQGVCYIDLETKTVQPIVFEDGLDTYIVSMCILKDDTVMCITNAGNAVFIKGHKAELFDYNGSDPNEILISATETEDGLYVGTNDHKILCFKGTIEKYTYEAIECPDLQTINEINYISDGSLWVCSDNGVGYYDKNMEFTVVGEDSLNNSVDNMIEDFEGNIWFTSSRQGIYKVTKNYFTDLNKAAGLADSVVNSTVMYKGLLYVATDTGLAALDENEKNVENEVTDYLKGVRVRNLLVTSDDKLWICSYGDTGLVSFDGSNIGGVNEGFETKKLRSAIEGADGSIVVAADNGIYYVKDDQVISHVGTNEGLTNPEILSLAMTERGTLYAGTDGGGVCEIKDGKVIETISEADGLKSGIVMRIRYDEADDSYWLITSNSLARLKDGHVTSIDKFPYSNNYDLYFGEADSVWILSSNGLYVTHRESLLDDEPLRYTFYDYNTGMPSTPTSNSFSYMDKENDIFYICGSSGVYSMNMKLEDQLDLTKSTITGIIADGERVWNKGEILDVAADTKRIIVDAYALNYGLQNPLISYYLEGFETEPTVVRKSDLSEIVYTNLAGGDYVFHFNIIDPSTGNIIEDKQLLIHKTYRMNENIWFYPLIVCVLAGVGVLCMYIILKLQMDRRMHKKDERQKQELADALNHAQSASMAKGSFLSNMSHEIRTPLNAIIGYLTIAQDTEDMGKIRHCLDNSDIAAKHLLQIINDILDMSSIENGKLKIAREDFDLKKEISDITMIFFQNAKTKSVNFETHIEALTQEWVIGDQLRINQILMNLLSNAVKFTDVGGDVSLSVKQLSEDEKKVYIQFVVRDSGIGMSEEYMQHVFEPFEQETASTAKKYGGTGLGLSITHNLVDMMGGRIDVESEAGKGTTFSVTMHFDKSEKQQNVIINKTDYSRLRAIIIDDQKEDANYLKSVLKHCGVKADIVTDAAASIKKITGRMGSDYAYDLCILDWKMPDMNGIELARQIRAKFGDQLPIIVATAYDIVELKEEAFAAGVNQVISKPVFQSTVFDLLVKTFGKYEPKAVQKRETINLKGLHIILAEDNEMNMEIAVSILEKAGVIVDQAENGKVAVQMFEAAMPGTYGLILMDIQMPVMNGYEATKQIRSLSHPDAKTIPIVAMTANAFSEDVAEALANGMNDHISKPVNYDKLFNVLERFSYK